MFVVETHARDLAPCISRRGPQPRVGLYACRLVQMVGVLLVYMRYRAGFPHVRVQALLAVRVRIGVTCAFAAVLTRPPL